MFSAADGRTRLSYQKGNAVICAQSLAEVYSQYADLNKAFNVVFSENVSVSDSGEYHITLDSKCAPDSNGTIELKAKETKAPAKTGEMRYLTLTFSVNDKELYVLQSSAYLPAGRNIHE